jgi:hypothetical protein
MPFIRHLCATEPYSSFSNFGLDAVQSAARVERESLTGIVMTLLQRAGRQDELPAWLSDRWRRIRQQVVAQNLHKWMLFGPPMSEAVSLGIKPVLLKGAVQNERVYRSSGARGMTDVDVLIHPNQVMEFDQCVRPAGFEPLTPWPIGGIDQSGSLNSQMYQHRAAQPEVRLHVHWNLINASVPLHRFYRPWDIPGLIARAVPCETYGYELYALTPQDHAMHVLEHALKHGYLPLVHGVDAWFAVKAVEDQERLQHAVRKQGLAWAWAGLSFLASGLGWEPLGGEWTAPGGWSSRYFYQRLRSGRRGGITALLGFLGMAGSPSRQIRCLRELLWPSAEQTDRFGWSTKNGASGVRIHRLIYGLANAAKASRD